MARIQAGELERLKAEVSLERLVEASGVALARQGKDFAARCPFHDDGAASLVVTPAKNLFHCFGCGAAGGPIDWVMRTQRSQLPPCRRVAARGCGGQSRTGRSKRSTVRALPPPVAFDADDQALLEQVVAYYHETLKQSPEALAYLRRGASTTAELIERFKLGYANRTLGLRLPEKSRKAGADIRARLERLGLYRRERATSTSTARW